jgi:hypothetical protein
MEFFIKPFFVPILFHYPLISTIRILKTVCPFEIILYSFQFDFSVKNSSDTPPNLNIIDWTTRITINFGNPTVFSDLVTLNLLLCFLFIFLIKSLTFSRLIAKKCHVFLKARLCIGYLYALWTEKEETQKSVWRLRLLMKKPPICLCKEAFF